jgi:hypothetical protein
MERIRFIEYKGKKILYTDVSNAKIEEAYKIMQEQQKIIFTFPENSLLIVINFENCEVTPKATYDLKEIVLQNKPYVKAAAVIGIGGVKKIILNAVSKFAGRNFYVCDKLEDALEWLVKQE